MRQRSAPQRRDWVVALGCMALISMTLGAVGEGGRRRAKEAVCQANLRQWNGIFQGYIEDHDGHFFTGVTMTGYYWPLQLSPEYQDWTRNRTWFCPTATTPMYDESGFMSSVPTTFSAWGIFSTPTYMTYGKKTYQMSPNGIAGSYSLNGYTLKVVSTYEGGTPASQGWADLEDVPDARRVPLFIDALRFDLWPRYTDAPAENENAAWSANNMARCCINRHDGAVNCLFVDGSVRKVGLKELWTLKWHRSFNTEGPWTRVGGVLPEDWPEWMRTFKDY
ncbi:MAG: H-X9-DG-CTERM domain-containing protein [Phycisphaerales bacterium]